MVLVVDGFLDDEACARVRASMDAGVAEPAEILRDAIDLDTGVRQAASIELDEDTLAALDARLDAEQAALARVFGQPLTTREGINALRYGAGGFYLPHVDRAEDSSWPDAARRRLAVVIFLNDDFDGGMLHVLDAGESVVPRRGRLVVFDAGLLHEVEPVRAGTRDVLVDWFYGV